MSHSRTNSISKVHVRNSDSDLVSDADNEFAQDVNHPLSRTNSSPNMSLKTSMDGTRSRALLDDVSQDTDGIRSLMNHGSWRSVIKLCDKLLLKSTYRHDYLQLKLCKITAQVKLRMYKAASDELNELGGFDEKPNLYENYSSMYQGMQGSMVPFSLRIIRAQLPYLLKTSSSVDGLYELLAVCRRELAKYPTQEKNEEQLTVPPSLENAITPLPAISMGYSSSSSLSLDNTDLWNNASDDALSTWISREANVSLLIVTRLIQEREFPLAIQLLQELVNKYPSNTFLLSSLGRVYLQLGNVKPAQQIFKQVETLTEEAEKVPLTHLNRGYVALTLDQFTTAIDHFQKVLDMDSGNVVAANNRAICLLYTCDLTRAISSLEEFIFKSPETNLNETLIFNLCTLYDLKSDNSPEKKKHILSLVGKYAPDHFDYSVIKLAN